MKKVLLSFFGILVMLHVQSQEPQTATKSRKFHIGLDYTFAQTNLKMVYMTKQYYWNDRDFGVNKLSQGQLDTLNSVYKYKRNLNGLAVEFGMILLNNPGGKWFIDGKITLGIAGTNYTIDNPPSDQSAMKISSGFSMPSAGLAFIFRYNFTPHWGLCLTPAVAYTFGKEKHIEDNTYPPIKYFYETRENWFQYLYSRTGVMATYIIKGFSVSAGPGFYILYSSNEYRINRISPDGKDIYESDIHSSLISKSFIDAEIAIEWRIIPALTVSVYGAMGNDLIVHPAIRYNF